MSFDYSKLKGRIVEILGTQSAFAQKMSWSQRTASLKLNGAIPWTQTDISKAVEILFIDPAMIPNYFFKTKVQDFEHLTKAAK